MSKVLHSLGGTVCWVFMSFPLAAQDHPKKVLTLSSAIQIAKEQSKMLSANRTERKISLSRLQQAKNEYLPGVGISTNYTRISDNINPFSINLPNSGEFVLNPQVLNQSFNSLQVRQNLWSGGKVRYGIQIRKLEEQAVVLDGKHTEYSVADSVATAWYSVLLLKTSEETIRQNTQLLRNQYKDLAKQERQGIIIGNDLLKLELAISSLETSLLEIISNKSIYTFNLATMLNDLPGTEYDLDTTLNTVSYLKLSLEELFADALKNRVELDVVKLRKKIVETSQKIVESDKLPTVSLLGSYDYNRPNQRVFPTEASYRGTWSLGATLRFDISGLYTSKAKVSEIRFAAEKLNTIAELVRDQIRMEVNANYQNFVKMSSKVDLALKALGQAKENFRVEQARLKATTITSTDFLVANNQLVQSELNLKAAQAGTSLAYWKLLKSTGHVN